MYLNYVDYENNCFSLERGLKILVKRSIRGKFDCLFIKKSNNQVVLQIYVHIASTEKSGYLSTAYTVKLDPVSGKFIDSENSWAPLYILDLVNQWPKHIYAVKQHRFNIIKKELLSHPLTGA
jgi:hypothetical protein